MDGSGPSTATAHGSLDVQYKVTSSLGLEGNFHCSSNRCALLPSIIQSINTNKYGSDFPLLIYHLSDPAEGDVTVAHHDYQRLRQPSVAAATPRASESCTTTPSSTPCATSSARTSTRRCCTCWNFPYFSVQHVRCHQLSVADGSSFRSVCVQNVSSFQSTLECIHFL